MREARYVLTADFSQQTARDVAFGHQQISLKCTQTITVCVSVEAPINHSEYRRLGDVNQLSTSASYRDSKQATLFFFPVLVNKVRIHEISVASVSHSSFQVLTSAINRQQEKFCFCTRSNYDPQLYYRSAVPLLWPFCEDSVFSSVIL